MPLVSRTLRQVRPDGIRVPSGPPAVHWDCVPTAVQQCLSGAILLALFSVSCLFTFTQADPVRIAAVVLLALAAGASLLRSLLRDLAHASAGVVFWDGCDWSWRATGAALSPTPATVGAVPVQKLQCVFALPECLLLTFLAPDNARHWLWLQCAADREQWQALRRALAFYERLHRAGLADSR